MWMYVVQVWAGRDLVGGEGDDQQRVVGREVQEEGGCDKTIHSYNILLEF